MFQCTTCHEYRNTMMGDTCNHCRDQKDKHVQMLNAIKSNSPLAKKDKMLNIILCITGLIPSEHLRGRNVDKRTYTQGVIDCLKIIQDNLEEEHNGL